MRDLCVFLLLLCTGCSYTPETAYYPTNTSPQYQVKGGTCWGIAGIHASAYYFEDDLRVGFRIYESNLDNNKLKIHVQLRKDKFNSISFVPLEIQVKIKGHTTMMDLIPLIYKDLYGTPEFYDVQTKNMAIDKEFYSKLQRFSTVYLSTKPFNKSDIIIIKPPDLIIDNRKYVFDEIEFKLDTKMHFSMIGNC